MCTNLQRRMYFHLLISNDRDSTGYLEQAFVVQHLRLVRFAIRETYSYSAVLQHLPLEFAFIPSDSRLMYSSSSASTLYGTNEAA